MNPTNHKNMLQFLKNNNIPEFRCSFGEKNQVFTWDTGSFFIKVIIEPDGKISLEAKENYFDSRYRVHEYEDINDQEFIKMLKWYFPKDYFSAIITEEDYSED
jgi:hypothetical protein